MAGAATTFFNAVQTCAVCDAEFTNAQSLGRWQCTEHPGALRGGRFTCCGLRVLETTRDDFYARAADASYRGCIRADHCSRDAGGRYRSHAESNTVIAVRKTTAATIGCLSDALAPIPGDPAFVRVLRYDAAAAEERRAAVASARK